MIEVGTIDTMGALNGISIKGYNNIIIIKLKVSQNTVSYI